MDAQTIGVVLLIVGALLLVLKKSGCCGMKGGCGTKKPDEEKK